jgi:hypothetical protein
VIQRVLERVKCRAAVGTSQHSPVLARVLGHLALRVHLNKLKTLVHPKVGTAPSLLT